MSESSSSVREKVATLIKLSFLIVCASLSALGIILQQIFQGTFTSVSPLRWLCVTFTPLLIVYYALLRNSLSRSGAALALVIGAVLSLANLSFFFSLLFFFISSSKATRFRESEKRRLEGAAFKPGGQRNWVQVMCNGATALELSLLYLLDVGSADLPIDFHRHYRATWLSLALLGSFSTCCGDTWASEIGSVWSKAQPRLITTLQKVPRGTNGAVSPAGLLVSLLGGATVGLGHYLGTALFSEPDEYLRAPGGQYLVVAVGAAAGLVGSLVDSLLGATCQFSGRKRNSEEIVEAPGRGVERISGMPLLDNHGVNLLSTVIMAWITPKMAMIIMG